MEPKVNAQDSPSNVIQTADLSRRNLFEPLIAPPPPAPKVVVPLVAAPPPPPKIPISQKAAHLRLVGIIRGTPLQAVVENQRTQTTAYVTSGQKIDEIEIEKVLEDHVILRSEDEHMDLTM
jgi:hypothetical protein